MTMLNAKHTGSKSQRGSTLLAAVVILLLASVMALMAMNVGVFEQRSSGNDLRAKIVHQAAEAGLAQGFEFLMRANADWLDDESRWSTTPCGATDEQFPCGAVHKDVRGSMYPLAAGAYLVEDLDPAITKYMLPLAPLEGDDKLQGVERVAYGVAPLLCRVPLPLSETSISCATGMTNLSDRRVVTFVSVARIRNDSGRTTLTQTVARSSLLAQGAGVPALVATGTVKPSGTGDVVAMPDAAGDGVGSGLNVSIWTRLDVDTKSAFSTCERGAFLASSKTSLNDPDWRAKSLTGGCPAEVSEGWDILDKDSNDGVNLDVVPSEFPADLFEYAFGVKTWENKTGDANFYESRRAKITVELNNIQATLYPDEAFLYANATQIIGDDLGLARPDQIKPNPGATSSGLIWCKTGCSKGPPGDPPAIGSVENPVVFVADGEMQTNGTIFYGMLFLRDPSDTLNEGTGGIASFKQNGSKAAVFGSVFVQGEFENGSGNGPIIGDREIMLALSNHPRLVQFDTLRGGWTDQYSY